MAGTLAATLPQATWGDDAGATPNGSHPRVGADPFGVGPAKRQRHGGVAVDRVSPAVDDHVVVARAPGGEVIRVGVAVVSLMANVTGLESVMGATPAEVGHRATLGV